MSPIYYVQVGISVCNMYICIYESRCIQFSPCYIFESKRLYLRCFNIFYYFALLMGLVNFCQMTLTFSWDSNFPSQIKRCLIECNFQFEHALLSPPYNLSSLRQHPIAYSRRVSLFVQQCIPTVIVSKEYFVIYFEIEEYSYENLFHFREIPNIVERITNDRAKRR